MKRVSLSCALIAGVLISSSSCTKVNELNPEAELQASRQKPQGVVCQSENYSLSAIADPASSTQAFSKTFDPITGQVKTISAGIYSIMISEHLDMNVHWQKNRVAFTSSSSPSDTILIANFDKKGNLVSIVDGNSPNENFLPTTFQYNGTRLSTMRVQFQGTELVSKFTYDRSGNVTRIQELPSNGTTPGYIEYKYNTGATAGNQIYLDEPRGFNRNTFTLAQYMGWLPSLSPVNVRTQSKVVWEDDYEVHNVYYKNHQTDGSGNLIKYEVASDANSDAYEQHVIGWKCPTTLVVQ